MAEPSVGGEMTTSLWAQKGPGAMTYRFAIGGTDADYQKAWASFGGKKIKLHFVGK